MANRRTTQPKGVQPSKGSKQATNNGDTVQVNKNENGEATNFTSKHGSEAPLQNTTSVPQNAQSEIKTTPAEDIFSEQDQKIAKEADERRTKDEVKFADQSNPNQKSRQAATKEAEHDQDGNPRTGGYSYGVAADDTRNTVAEKENEGNKPEDDPRRASQVGSFVNPDEGESVNENGWTLDDKQKLEDKLSDPANGISARVTTAAGDYVRVKFFYNNKPLATHTSRNFKASEASKVLKEAKKLRGL